MERLKREKRRKPSSRAWLERQINDPYVARAKREGFRSRAAYKLAEIDEKFHLFKPGTCVVDLGSAPGGWSEVAARRVGASGRVVALDILDMKPVSGVEFLKLDFLDQAALDRLKAVLGGNGQGKVHAKAQAKVQAKAQGKADVVLSDMAANATGHRQTDHLRIMALAEAAAQFAREVLSPGGSFLCKVLQGGTETSLLSELKHDFLSVKHVKPPASRSGSAELYLLARGFRGGG
jgi:23S rRNA (uridine2552-2'-O)-methyltransferase